MVQPAAAEVGPAPFSQPRAALLVWLGVKLQPQTDLCLMQGLLGGHLSPRRSEEPSGWHFNALRAVHAARCPCAQEKVKGELQSLPFSKMLIFAVTNPVMQKEKLPSKQKGHTSRVVQL